MLIFSHLPTAVALGASMLNKYDFFTPSNTVILTSALESNLKHARGNMYLRLNVMNKICLNLLDLDLLSIYLEYT